MYYIVYGILWLLSLLPLKVLYIFSDGFYFLAYHLIKYRRSVVMHNLRIAFPEKTEKDRIIIAKKFYHNLIDMFIETIKMISASDKFFAKRLKGNWEIINNFYPTGKRVQLHLGHNFNWEWLNNVLVNQTPYKWLAVYMPIANKIFEKLFYKLRTRSGSIFLRATQMQKEFLPYRNSQYLLGLVADQSPSNPAEAWWFNFLGKPTSFLKGPAKRAKVNNAVVVFAFIHKPKRGYYEVVFSLAEENPKNITDQELTKRFVVYLENVVRQYPDMWLWSHRRWKWEWKPEYGEIIS